MNAVVIPSCFPYTLSPVADGSSIGKLPVLGVSFYELISEYLEKYDIDVNSSPTENNFFSRRISSSAPLLLYEENLLTDFDLSKLLHLMYQIRNTELNQAVHGFDMTVILRSASADDYGLHVILKEAESPTELILSAKHGFDKAGIIDCISKYSFSDIPFSYSLLGIFLLHPNTEKGKRFFDVNLQKTVFDTQINGFDLISRGLSAGIKILGLTDNSAHRISVNTQADYIKAHRDIMQKKLNVFSRLTYTAHEIRDGFWAEYGTEIKNDILVNPPVYISSGCRIAKNVKLGPNLFLGKNCHIGKECKISDSVLLNGTHLQSDCSITGAVVSTNVSIDSGTEVSENSVIGSGCRIEENCIISRGVKISRNKKISRGTRLNSSLINASLATEALFKHGTIDGEFNIDITPEFMTKLGAALGTMYPNSKIATACDSSPMCELLQNAVACGIASTGCRIFEFGKQALPVIRYGIRHYGPSCGIYIGRNDDKEDFSAKITVLNSSGTALTSDEEKTLTDIFFDCAYLRCDSTEINEKSDLKSFKSLCEQDILNRIKSNFFHSNVQIRTSSESVSDMLEEILSRLEEKTVHNTKTCFTADISRCGERVLIYPTDMPPINKYTQLYLIAILLTEHFNCGKIVLPVSASQTLWAMLKRKNIKIILSAANEDNFMRKIVENNLMLQFKLCFDGTFLAIALLDFLNHNNTTLSEIITQIPDPTLYETEVECAETRKRDIIRILYDKYGRDYKTDLTDGIKIYQKVGWILIIPREYRHCIRIISEGFSAEASKELGIKFTNQIKRLAKPK